jgi:excisionase family DNA binding protein
MIEIRVGQLAQTLGVHRNTVRNWIKTSELAAKPIIGKKYAVEKEAFIEFLQSKNVARDKMDELVNSMISGTPSNSFPLEKVKKTQTPIILKEVPMLDKPVGSVMVVGGGIAGIQASLDLADSGYYVYLLEKSPGIGGGMAKLDKTFPTNDCAM